MVGGPPEEPEVVGGPPAGQVRLGGTLAVPEVVGGPSSWAGSVRRSLRQGQKWSGAIRQGWK